MYGYKNVFLPNSSCVELRENNHVFACCFVRLRLRIHISKSQTPTLSTLPRLLTLFHRYYAMLYYFGTQRMYLLESVWMGVYSVKSVLVSCHFSMPSSWLVCVLYTLDIASCYGFRKYIDNYCHVPFVSSATVYMVLQWDSGIAKTRTKSVSSLLVVGFGTYPTTIKLKISLVRLLFDF